MKELVQVNLAKRKIKANFLVYVSIFDSISEEIFANLQS
jgi:hypothetical protein